MSDIFREVDEEIRQENYAKLWKRYGSYAIGFAVLLVAAVAGYQIWQNYDLERRTELSDRYAAVTGQVLEDQDSAAQAALSEIADPSDAGYGTLAAFARAQLLAEAGNTAESGRFTWRISMWPPIIPLTTERVSSTAPSAIPGMRAA